MNRHIVDGLGGRRPASFIGEINTPINAKEIRHFLGPVSSFYPNFDQWFWAKFCPEMDGLGRSVLVERVEGSLAGVALLKRNNHETKICTLFVAPSYRGRGIGGQLLDASHDWLGCRSPLITVCEERYIDISPALESRGYCLGEVVESYYREGRKEFVFNGFLPRI